MSGPPPSLRDATSKETLGNILTVCFPLTSTRLRCRPLSIPDGSAIKRARKGSNENNIQTGVKSNGKKIK
jgi:hypothetical protein